MSWSDWAEELLIRSYQYTKGDDQHRLTCLRLDFKFNQLDNFLLRLSKHAYGALESIKR